jgi:sugar/nucleoside kinase (ribokinase family)
MLLQANHLHIGGFYSCASLRGNLKPLLTKARAKGITISLDTNYDSSEKWSDLDTILPLVDIFMPNDVEALAISKKKNVDEALQFFSDKVLTLTVIKIGKQGAKAICSKTKQIWHHGSFEATFLDATGAGDSFNSGFLSAYKMSNGKNIYESLKWGCATASKIVANLGACGFEIDYQDVNEIITNSK